MQVQRIVIDYQTGAVSVDAELGEEFGRDFEFALAERPDFDRPARDLREAARSAVKRRIRDWLLRAEAEDSEPDLVALGDQR